MPPHSTCTHKKSSLANFTNKCKNSPNIYTKSWISRESLSKFHSKGMRQNQQNHEKFFYFYHAHRSKSFSLSLTFETVEARLFMLLQIQNKKYFFYIIQFYISQITEIKIKEKKAYQEYIK